MLDPNLTVAYIVVATALAIAPGPDVMFVLANSLRFQTKGAIAGSLGVCAGTMFHSLAAAIGISALIAASPFAFNMLRYGGALYLVYLGFRSIQAFFSSSQLGVSDSTFSVGVFKVFTHGLLTNVLNPKVIIFYLALLPQFVNIELGRVGLQIFLLGCIHASIGLVYLMVLGSIAGRASSWIVRSQVRRWLDGIAGIIFFALAARLFFAK